MSFGRLELVRHPSLHRARWQSGFFGSPRQHYAWYLMLTRFGPGQHLVCDTDRRRDCSWGIKHEGGRWRDEPRHGLIVAGGKLRFADRVLLTWMQLMRMHTQREVKSQDACPVVSAVQDWKPCPPVFPYAVRARSRQ